VAMKRVGLDIGATHVRVAEVEFSGKGPGTTGSGTLTAFAEAPLPRGAVQGGEVIDVSAVATAIKKAVAAAGTAGKEVVIGVGSEGVIVREIEIPELPMAQLRSSLPFQVQEMLPMSTSESLLDFYPTAQRVDGSSSLLRGIMVAAPKTTVSQNLLAVEGAGLRPVGVDLNGFALMRSQMTSELAARIVAFVDIGARITNVVITQGGQPRLVRTLAGGGQDATDAVAAALHIDVQEAEELKRHTGLGEPANRQLQGAHEAILGTTRSLVESIRNTFVYYASNNPGEAIEHVVITGGGAHLAGLGQYLASATRLPVRYGNSFARVSASKKLGSDATKGLDARVPVAIGLAFGEAS
jgi:type IV pilus assembly protein PilM